MAAYLFFDSETTGLPRDWNAPASDVDNWPRLVQIAWIACDAYDDSLEPEVHLIQPNGFTIPTGAFKTHGISTEYATDNGVPLLPVLSAFQLAVKSAEILIGHNLPFDAAVVGAEFVRAGIANPLSGKQGRCTMRGSTNFCRLPGNYGKYKWPTLPQLHSTLFKCAFDGAHGARADCLACMKCFFRLKELNVMS